MKKVENELEIISEITGIKDKTIIDVGCGTGGLVRKLAAEGAEVIGIDRPDMLVKAKDSSSNKNEENNQKLLEGVQVSAVRKAPCAMRLPPGRRRHSIFIAGLGENLPFKNNYADIIIFFASFHHIPGAMMKQTLQETQRVLKTGGIGIFLEPIGREGSYFEILRLVEDERDIQRLAFESIKKVHTFGLENKKEEIIYVERSFDDYVNLLNVFVDDAAERNGYLKEARKITERLNQEAGIPFEDYRFKSICRINVLQRS
jgi:ubiquinone/menaquinone biosynthesis C-methylase UbiE